MKQFLKLLLLSLITVLVFAESHQTLQLEKPYSQSLNQTTMFTGRYVFTIPEQNVKKMKGDKWFFFVEVEPDQENQWISTTIQISIGKKASEQSKNQRTCATNKGGIDSCFFTNKQFDYKTQDIHVRVHCKGACKFKLSAEISQPYKLTPGEHLDMDFQNTAYSKVFILDTSNRQNFDQLRIILKPQGFLQFPAPIGLYVNKGTQVPTRKSHDFQSITLWDNGEGVFIDSPDSQNVFTILVESPEKNLLVLYSQLISFKDSYDIPESLPYFDYIGQGSKKLYRAKVHPQKGVCIKLSTFSGSIQLSKVYDNQKQPLQNQFPELYRSFSQSQYHIPVEFFKKNEKLYEISQYIIFQVEGIKESTFLIESFEITKGISHLIPVVNRYIDIPGQSSNQYYIELVEINTPQFKKSEIQIVITHEENKKLKTRFFQCNKEHGKECEIKKSQLKQANVNSEDFKELNPTLTQTIGAVTIHKFYFKSKQFRVVKNDIKEYIITVYIENQQKEEQLYTIRYTNIGHNVYLKQKQVQKDRISIDQTKYYLYTNRDSDVKQIRVHLMQIAGRVHIQGYYEDPRVNNLEGKQIYDFHNALKYTNLQNNQTIYVKVTGKEIAYYSLQVQSIRETDKQWWKRIQSEHNKSKGYNEIVIFQDIPYQFSLEPNEKAVYQIHTKHKEFNLDLSSLLPLELCMTEQLIKAPFPPNCEVKQELSKRQMMTVQMERGQIANIGVTNNHTKSNKFNIKISSIDSPSNSSHPIQPEDNYTTAKCLPALLGKTIMYTIQKQTSTCYTYLISKIQSMELTLDVVSDQYNKINVLAALGEERIEILGANHVFKKNQVEKACKDKDPCLFKLFIDSQVKTQLRFSVQTLDGTVFLLDGIASSFSGAITKRYFAYEVYNKINTTIILENKNGYYKFYGTIVQASTYWKQKENYQYPSAISNTIKSSNPFYYTYQIAILTQNQITDAKCKECLLLLTVQKQKDASGGDERSRFTIECTQQQKFLKQSSSVVSYLSKRSFAFYQLYNIKQGTVLISLNTQNQQCAKIYVRKGKNRATGSQYDHESNSNILIIQKAEKSSYSVTIEATEDCYYSIDYTSSTNKIYTSLSPGLYTDVRLDKQSSQYVAYHHTTNQSFRILTLHQMGEIIINVRAYKTMKEYFNENTAKTKNVWSGKDFVRIQKTDTTFCSQCYYIIELSAQRQTRTSIIIPSESSEFPIMVDSIMKEQLKKGQYQRLRVYTQKIVQFQINVQYGAVNVSLYSKDNDKNSMFTKIYKADQITHYEEINNTKSSKTDSFYYAQFTKIILKAEEDSGFYFSLISDKDVTKRGSRIKYGIPEYVTLEKGKDQCLIGTLDNEDEQFLISITGENDTILMNSLEITCKTSDNKLLELSKDIAKNQMIVKIQKPPKKLPTQYEFCMRAKENVFLTFIQSSRLLYLPELTTVMVGGNMNFSFYSQGKSILQINECKSRAVTTIYNSFAASSNNANSQIKQVRRSNNIVEFMYYGPVYVQINTSTATIAWRKKDELKKLGRGYEQYSPSKIRYDIIDKKLKVTISGLKLNANIDKPVVQFEQTSYTAYIAQQEINLYQAINCANGLYLQQSNRNKQATSDVTIFFNIEKILQKFGNKKYVLIGALLNATSNIKNDGKYRFLYPYQQIPISMLKGTKPEEQTRKPNPNPRPKPVDTEPIFIQKENNSYEILMYLVISIVIIFLGFFIYRKFLKRFFKRRRMEKLSEQGTGQVRYQQFNSESSNR